jgi:hypothetical protein
MSNIVQLFVHEQIENPANLTNATIAVADFLALFAELARDQRHSRDLDSIDHLFDPIRDPEAWNLNPNVGEHTLAQECQMPTRTNPLAELRPDREQAPRQDGVE